MALTQKLKPIRSCFSFKQTEKHLLDDRDHLCNHYNLNKSDIIKFLIKKETYNLKNTHSTFIR